MGTSSDRSAIIERVDWPALGAAFLLALPAAAVLAIDLAVLLGRPWPIVAPLTVVLLVPVLYLPSTNRGRVGTTVLLFGIAAFLFPVVIVAGTRSAAADASDPIASAGSTVDGMALFLVVWAFSWAFAWVCQRVGRKMMD